MLGVDVALEVDRPDVVDVFPDWFPVNRTGIQLRILPCGRVDGVDIDDRHGLVEDLSPGLHQLSSSLVQVGSLHEQAVDVDSLWGVFVDLILVIPGHQVLSDDAVQGPAFV